MVVVVAMAEAADADVEALVDAVVVLVDEATLEVIEEYFPGPP